MQLFKNILLNNHTGLFIANFDMLWLSALSIGIVIVVGFIMASKRMKRKPVPPYLKVIHRVATLIGASIVIVVAFMGDYRLWTNIILSLIIVILGLLMSLKKVSKANMKKVLFSHAIIGITCYIIFLYYIVAGV